MQFKRSTFSVVMSLVSLTLLGAAGRARAQFGCDATRWQFGGGDIFNSRYAAGETRITASNAHSLRVKWQITTAGDVSATPTVETYPNGETTVYAVDWGGYLYSINGATGHINWSKPLKTYTGNPNGSVSRTSPAIVGNLLIVGDQGNVNNGGALPVSNSGVVNTSGATASIMAIDKFTGHLVWRKVVSKHPYSVITSSPVVHDGILYVGVASLEENAGFLFQFGYPGFSFRGSVVALDIFFGDILWRYDTISQELGNKGYTGASVWGSTPVVDEKRHSLYVGTGNNYSIPANLVGTNLDVDPADHIDSILALDLYTGCLKWAFSGRANTQDTWDVKSFAYHLNVGPDSDFGSGPNLFKVNINGHNVDLLGAGEKSGVYWALNPDDGSVHWQTRVGPTGTGGGIEWGSATDGNRIYCASANSNNTPITINGVQSTGGNWAALDAATGLVQWQTLDPIQGTQQETTVYGHDYGMVTIANGVVFAGSAGMKPAQDEYGNAIAGTGIPGGFFALNAQTGAILWSYTSADDPVLGSVNSGASVVNGTVYWGSGYSHLSNNFGISGTPKLYAFSLPQ